MDILIDNFNQLKVQDEAFDIPPGLEKSFKDLSILIKYPILYQLHFLKLGIECPRGVLLYGPPGVGKTFLIRLLCKQYDCELVSISGPEVYSPYSGESETRLRNKFFEAHKLSNQENKNCIIFIDEIDAMTPKREDNSNTVESRVVAQLLTLMDGLKNKENNPSKVLVIAATNRPNAIDSALRRPGRFDREVSIDPPNNKSRSKILKYWCKKFLLKEKTDYDIDFDKLGEVTVGYVGADLKNLTREALTNHLPLTNYHFIQAMTKILPSLQRHESNFQGDKTGLISFDSLAGIDDIKNELKMAIEWPIKFGDNFKRLGLKPPRGILLYGPPGCSKTSLVKVIAATSNLSMFTLSGAQVYSSYVGESEAIIRTTFERARRAYPSLIFLDEIDTLAGKRDFGGEGGDTVQDRILSMLLNEMDGVQAAGSILIMAATNRPDNLDPALLRPGRFDKQIYIGPPNQQARLHILKLYTKSLPLHDDVILSNLANITINFTGADIQNLCREASLIALRQIVNQNQNDKELLITNSHFQIAFKAITPSINPNSLLSYIRFQKS